MDDSWTELGRPIVWKSESTTGTAAEPIKRPHTTTIVAPTIRTEKVTVVEALKQKKVDIKSRIKNTGIDTRRIEMATHWKAKRAETQFANRGIDVGILKDGISSMNCSDKSEKSMSTTSTSITSKLSDGSIEASVISDARRKQLNKWKQEKNALQNKPEKKSFNPGGRLNSKPQQLPPVIRQKLSGGINKVQPLPAAKPPAMISSTVQPQIPERRVTRAMTKGTGKIHTATETKTIANNKPISHQMSALTINPNNRAGVRGGTKTLATSKHTISKNEGVSNDRPGKSVVNKKIDKPIEMEVETDLSRVSSEQESMKTEPVITVPKKSKPQAIDEVYAEYNFIFSQASKQLSEYSKYWRTVVDNSKEIPDDIRDDIISALGKVQLLMSSKLPQFVQLLYSYLCKEMTPCPILECDLQGWWDVAAIQVTAVCSEFEKLKALEINKWIRQETVLTKSKPTSTATNCVKMQPKVVAKASKGMKEFLALKRKINQSEHASTGSTTSGSTCVDSSSSGALEEVEKKFEGGFFVISSPARATNTPVYSRRSSIRRNGLDNSVLTPNKPPPHTPGSRRRISTNLSLRSLSLRNSMGTIYKLGAVGSVGDVVLNGIPSSGTDFAMNKQPSNGAEAVLKTYCKGQGLPDSEINVIQ